MRLFAFDIDSTLYDEEAHCFPEDTVQSLAQLQTLGHMVVVATGRPPCKARQIYDAGIHPDFLICNNGHCIFDSEGKVIYERRFSKEQSEKITKFCQNHGMGLFWSYNDDVHVYYRTKALEHLIYRNKRINFCFGPCGIHREEEPLGACISGNNEQLKLFEEEFREYTSVIRVNSEYGDLVLKGSSKWDAINMLCDKLSILHADTMAFGDNFNDAEMIINSGTGVAMGNGTPELKAVADYITTNVGEKGIYNALKHFQILQ